MSGDFDFDFSPEEQDLLKQAKDVKDYTNRFKMYKQQKLLDYKMQNKAFKSQSKADIKKTKAKNKPLIKLISTVGLVVYLMKFMDDHHSDKLTKDNIDEAKDIGKALGLSENEVKQAIKQAEQQMGSTSSNSSNPANAKKSLFNF